MRKMILAKQKTKIVLAAVLLLGAPVLSAAEKSVDKSQWKKITFSEATAGKFEALELEISLPEGYAVRDSGKLETGIFWGRSADLKIIFKTPDLAFSDIEQGVFHVTRAKTTAYLPEQDKFDGEDEMQKQAKEQGIVILRQDRRNVGGYPAWIFSYRLGVRDFYVFYIATLNGSNVISIVYVPGKNFSPADSSIWESFVQGVGRPEYVPAQITGKDPQETLAKVFAAAAAGKERQWLITSELTLGPLSARVRPRIWEKAVLRENQSGFLQMQFEHTAQGILNTGKGKEDKVVEFGDNWVAVPMRGEITLEEGTVSGRFAAAGRVENVTDQLDKFKVVNNITQIILGAAWVTAEPFENVLGELLGLFDFKEERAAKTIVLSGIPRRQEFARLLRTWKIPAQIRGMDMAEELMKHWAKGTVVIDPKSYAVREFRAEGMYALEPFFARIVFEEGKPDTAAAK